MGIEARAATEEELCRIEQALRRELDAGAAGMSSGLIYIPCVYATTEEMIRLCRILRSMTDRLLSISAWSSMIL